MSCVLSPLNIVACIRLHLVLHFHLLLRLIAHAVAVVRAGLGSWRVLLAGWEELTIVAYRRPKRMRRVLPIPLSLFGRCSEQGEACAHALGYWRVLLARVGGKCVTIDCLECLRALWRLVLLKVLIQVLIV